MRGQLPGSPKPTEGEKKEKRYTRSLDAFDEMDVLIDREHTCMVCRTSFTTKSVCIEKAQSDGMDLDTRPRFKNIDPIKYRIVECPVCGFADFERYFKDVSQKEIAVLKEKRLKNDKYADLEEISRDYPDAYRYYKSVMRCGLIRGSKSSKRGYTALNTAWLLRGWRENLKRDDYIIQDTDPMCEEEERKVLKYALRNFMEAETKESFPICGMDESTFDYLMAALCYEQGQIMDSQRYLLRCLQNRTLKPVLRVKAEDLREMIRERKRNSPVRI